MNKLIRTFICYWIAALLCLAGVFSAAAETTTGWTVMIYMVGSDLETKYMEAEKDLTDIQESVRDDMTLLVMTGGAADWSNGIPSEGCHLYRITRDERILLNDVDGTMADSRTLELLLEAGRETGDELSALILWDHGYGAVEGFGKDEMKEDAHMSLSAIAGAMKNAGLEEHPLSVIGFDACMMSGCETVASLAPFGDLLLASEETENRAGWDYSFLREITPSTDAKSFSHAVMQSFVEFFTAQNEATPERKVICTLTMTDMRQSGTLLKWAEAFFSDLNDLLQEGRYPDISRARENAWAIGRELKGATDYDLVDLYSLAACSIHLSKAATPLMAAIEQCVTVDGNEENAHGLSVYFPRAAKESHMLRWEEKLNDLSLPDSWRNFIRNYTTEMLAGTTESVVSPKGETEFSVVLDDAHLEVFRNAKYYVLCGNETDGMYLRYAGGNCSLVGHTLTAMYDRCQLTLTVPGKYGQGERTIPMLAFWIYNDNGNAYYSSPVIAYIRNPKAEDAIGGGFESFDSMNFVSPVEPRTVVLRIAQNLSTGEWTIVSVIDRSHSDQPMVGEEFVTGRMDVNMEDVTELLIASPIRIPDLDPEIPWDQWEQSPDRMIIDYAEIQDGYRLEEIPIEEQFEDEGYNDQCWLQIVMTDIYNRDHALLMTRIQ